MSILHAVSKRFNDALDLLREAWAADSLWPILPCAEVFILCCRGDYDRAAACGRKALDLHPYLPMGRSHYAQALELAGRLDEALVEYRRACIMSPDLPRLRAEEGRCLAMAGYKADAAAVLNELEPLRQTEYVDAYHMALLQDALGRRDEAVRELERALNENSCQLFMLDVDPRMQSLSRLDGFSSLRNKVFRDIDAMSCAPGLPDHSAVAPNAPSTVKDSSQRRSAAF